MPEGKCVECGMVYCGWALVYSKDKCCDFCGGELKLEES